MSNIIPGAIAQYLTDKSPSIGLDGKILPDDQDGTNINMLTGEPDREGRGGWCYTGDGSTTNIQLSADSTSFFSVSKSPNINGTEDVNGALFEFYFKVPASVPVLNQFIVSGFNNPVSFVRYVYFYVTTGVLAIEHSSSLTGATTQTTTTDLRDNEWHFIEFQWDWSNKAAVTMDVRVDGNTEIAYTYPDYSATGTLLPDSDMAIYISGLLNAFAGGNSSFCSIYGVKLKGVGGTMAFNLPCQEESGTITFNTVGNSNGTITGSVHTFDPDVTFSDADDRGAGIVVKDIMQGSITLANTHTVPLIAAATDFTIVINLDYFTYFIPSGANYFFYIFNTFSGSRISLNADSLSLVLPGGTTASFSSTGNILADNVNQTIILEYDHSALEVRLRNTATGYDAVQPADSGAGFNPGNSTLFALNTSSGRDFAPKSIALYASIGVGNNGYLSLTSPVVEFLDIPNSNADTGSEANPISVKPLADGVVPLLEDGTTPANTAITQAQYIGEYKPYFQLETSPALSFTGAQKYITVNLSLFTNSTKRTTIVYKETSSGYGGMFSESQMGELGQINNLLYRSLANTSYYGTMTPIIGTLVANELRQSSPTFTIGWHTIREELDIANKLYSIYLNDELVIQFSYTNTVPGLNNGGVMFFGTISSNSASNWEGAIAAIYDPDTYKGLFFMNNVGTQVYDTTGQSYTINNANGTEWGLLSQNLVHYLQAKGGTAYPFLIGGNDETNTLASTITIPLSTPYKIEVTCIMYIGYFEDFGFFVPIADTSSTAIQINEDNLSIAFSAGGNLIFSIISANIETGVEFTFSVQRDVSNNITATVNGVDFNPSEIRTATVSIQEIGAGGFGGREYGRVSNVKIWNGNDGSAAQSPDHEWNPETSLLDTGTATAVNILTQTFRTGYLPSALNASGNPTGLDVQDNQIPNPELIGRTVRSGFGNDLNLNPEFDDGATGGTPMLTQLGYYVDTDDHITTPEALGSLFSNVKAREEQSGQFNNLLLSGRGRGLQPMVTLSDASDQYISWDNNGGAYGNIDELGFWFSSTDTAADSHVGEFIRFSSGNSRSVQIALSGGKFRMLAGASQLDTHIVNNGTPVSAFGFVGADSSGTYNDGIFHYLKVLISTNGVGHTFTLYVDDVLEISVYYDFNAVYNNNYIVGSDAVSSVIGGKVAGSDSDITASYCGIVGKLAGVKVFEFPVNEGVGTICNNVINQTYNATLVNSATWLTQNVYDYGGAYGENVYANFLGSNQPFFGFSLPDSTDLFMEVDTIPIIRNITKLSYIGSDILFSIFNSATPITSGLLTYRYDNRLLINNGVNSTTLGTAKLAEDYYNDLHSVPITLKINRTSTSVTVEAIRISDSVVLQSIISTDSVLTNSIFPSRFASSNSISRVTFYTDNTFTTKRLEFLSNGSSFYTNVDIIGGINITSGNTLGTLHPPAQLPLNGTDVLDNALTTETIERTLDEQQGLRLLKK